MTTIGRFHTISDLFCKTVSFGPFPDRDYIALLWLIHGEIKQYTQHIATRDTLQRSQIYFAKPFRVVHFPIVIILPFYDWFMGKSSSTRNTLQHATHCNTLQHIVTHCNTLQHIATHCYTLQHIATHCNTLQHIATHCNTLLHIATHCNTLHHIATHCNTLQHIATHCTTRQAHFAASTSLKITCMTWPIHVYDMTASHVWYDLFTCVTWLIHMCDVTQSHVRHESFTFTCVAWLINMRDLTHSHVLRQIHALQLAATHCNTLQHNCHDKITLRPQLPES